jgi:hypothetical protein
MSVVETRMKRTFHEIDLSQRIAVLAFDSPEAMRELVIEELDLAIEVHLFKFLCFRRVRETPVSAKIRLNDCTRPVDLFLRINFHCGHHLSSLSSMFAAIVFI